MPRCFGAAGSVRASVKSQLASCPRVVQIFCPSSTNSSPSLAARVVSELRSDPAPGSE